MQLHECCFEQEARDSPSFASVRICRNDPVFTLMMFTNYRERIVVAQNREIILRGIIRIARMVRSNRGTGYSRKATIIFRITMMYRVTTTRTTSVTGRNSTFLKTRPTRACRIVLCPCLLLYLVRGLIWLLPKPPRLCPRRTRECRCRRLRLRLCLLPRVHPYLRSHPYPRPHPRPIQIHRDRTPRQRCSPLLKGVPFLTVPHHLSPK